MNESRTIWRSESTPFLLGGRSACLSMNGSERKGWNKNEEDWAFRNWILKVDTKRNFITPYFCLFVHKLLDWLGMCVCSAHSVAHGTCFFYSTHINSAFYSRFFRSLCSGLFHRIVDHLLLLLWFFLSFPFFPSLYFQWIAIAIFFCSPSFSVWYVCPYFPASNVHRILGALRIGE